MLVLTRKYQEKIRIGDNITITVLRTKGKAVRLGIEAPSDVPVVRGELTFESATSVTATSGPLEATPKVATIKRPAVRAAESAPAWATESPQQANRGRVSPSASHVSLKRMPRDKVADVLPPLIAGDGPLRAMMVRR
jgi:carbon storage regulator CsrA